METGPMKSSPCSSGKGFTPAELEEPITPKQKCTMPECDRVLGKDKPWVYCRYCKSNTICRWCRLHIESMPTKIFRVARQTMGLDHELCHTCAVLTVQQLKARSITSSTADQPKQTPPDTGTLANTRTAATQAVASAETAAAVVTTAARKNSCRASSPQTCSRGTMTPTWAPSITNTAMATVDASREKLAAAVRGGELLSEAATGVPSSSSAGSGLRCWTRLLERSSQELSRQYRVRLAASAARYAEEHAVVAELAATKAEAATEAASSSPASNSLHCWKRIFPRSSRELSRRYRIRLEVLSARYAEEHAAVAELAATQSRNHVRRAAAVSVTPAAVLVPEGHGQAVEEMARATAGGDDGARDGRSAPTPASLKKTVARERARIAAFVQGYANDKAQGTRDQCERVVKLFERGVLLGRQAGGGLGAVKVAATFGVGVAVGPLCGQGVGEGLFLFLTTAM